MSSANKTVLITGSTRGIGLAFAGHKTKAGWNVIGMARASSNMEKLKALSPIKIGSMDTSDEATILEAARQLDGQPIDLLINNAGIVSPLSSFFGSIGSCTDGTAVFFKQVGYGYSSSKAALNMITCSLAFDLRPSGVVVVSVHPGYVDTDMTGGKATLKPADSVAAMIGFIAKLNPDSTGKFFNLDPQNPAAELLW